MGGAGNVKKEGHLIVGGLAAHVAGKRIGEAMVAHVHGVHDDILEGDIAERALVSTAPLSRSVARSLFLLLATSLFLHNGLLRGRIACRPLKFESLSLASMLGRMGVVPLPAEIQRRRIGSGWRRRCPTLGAHGRWLDG